MPVMVSSQDAEDLPTTEPPAGKKAGSGKRKWLFILAGIFLVVLAAGIGSWIGYQTAINERLEKQHGQVAMAAVTQYQLGLEDENAGRLDVARQRYEYVIKLDPNFPGIQERLSAVMLSQAQTNVPTIAPTETPIPVTPTPDMRGIEEKYAAAATYMRANDWENAVAALELVRKEDITYRTADIDGMFYIALRYRGIQKISGGSLEPGIYDLTLSELFAPLDNQALGFRNWARYYLTGASFWGVDWEKVIEIFADVYPSMPNMIDSSGWTAQERYRVANLKYAEKLAGEGKYCEAVPYYETGLSLGPDEAATSAYEQVMRQCAPPEEDTPEPTVEETITETVETPTETPEVVETTEVPTDPPPPAEGATPTP